ncbi:MAG TPA: homogentisate 1,2-dioxygenase, partial [candidate division Zixibacteria bacterium]|nr:homogentisate 1,2-dioxygenase [candidate division Zixibacteria bacterium]
MPFYHRLGDLPPVKHTTFYKPDGKSLYREELFSSKGFSGVYSTKYHFHPPTEVLRMNDLSWNEDIDWPEAPVLYYHFFTDKKKSSGTFITARKLYLRNQHCHIYTAHVTSD